MRVLICGGRDFEDKATLFKWLDEIHKRLPITMVIEGGARGADSLGRKWAEIHRIPVQTFEADWSWGGRAGAMRNQKMLREGKPQLVVVAPGGVGTWDMLDRAQRAGVPIFRI